MGPRTEPWGTHVVTFRLMWACLWWLLADWFVVFVSRRSVWFDIRCWRNSFRRGNRPKADKRSWPLTAPPPPVWPLSSWQTVWWSAMNGQVICQVNSVYVCVQVSYPWLDWIMMMIIFILALTRRLTCSVYLSFYNSCQTEQVTSLKLPDRWPHGFMCLSSDQHVNQLINKVFIVSCSLLFFCFIVSVKCYFILTTQLIYRL